jgi:hypothetical protein
MPPSLHQRIGKGATAPLSQPEQVNVTIHDLTRFKAVQGFVHKSPCRYAQTFIEILRFPPESTSGEINQGSSTTTWHAVFPLPEHNSSVSLTQMPVRSD